MTRTSDTRGFAQLRGLNLERILTIAMERSGSFTRAELIDATGLSAPTVGTLAADLIKAGLLRDLGAGPSRGGRRPSMMEFNAQHGLVAGVRIGPTHTVLAVADLRGAIVNRTLMPTPIDLSPAAALLMIASEVRALVRKAHSASERLLAITVGAPGAVDPHKGVVVGLAPNLPGWSRVPVTSVLRRALRAPVFVDNDVNLAILGECWRGAARGHDTCAFITVGTGIGAGILIDGKLHHGRHFLAGEIALMCMGPEYVDSEFGARGCLETLVGLTALSDRWSRHHGPLDPGGWLDGLFQAARSGDPHARQIIDEAVRLIGIATANLSVVIDPSVIVLGGVLIAHCPAIAEDVRRIVSRVVPEAPCIVVSELKEEAPLWGSLLVAAAEAQARLRQRVSGAPVGGHGDRADPGKMLRARHP